MDEPRKFFGKYRGVAVETIDPLGLGRILVECPTLSGLRLNWAMPCVPYAGAGVGAFIAPPIGASVWVEFEGGDLDYPVWTGCFWTEGQSPFVAGPTSVLKTDTVTVTVDDRPEGAGFDVSVTPAVGDLIRISATDAGLSITVGAMRISAAGDTVTVASGTSVLTLTPDTAALSAGSASLFLAEDRVQITGKVFFDEGPA